MSSRAMKPPKHITTNGSRLLSQPAVAAGIGLLPDGSGGPGIDADRRRQTRTQLAEARIGVVERDPHRYALDDLGEVAGGVLRRDHGEDRARARRQALDVAVNGLARAYVGNDRRGLAGPHVRELVFLEIGVDPEPV